MSFIDEKYAPEGYFAVAAENHLFCGECAFTDTFYKCFAYSIMCDARNREDKQNVIFIKNKQKKLFSAMELGRQENLPPEQLIEPDEED